MLQIVTYNANFMKLPSFRQLTIRFMTIIQILMVVIEALLLYNLIKKSNLSLVNYFYNIFTKGNHVKSVIETFKNE